MYSRTLLGLLSVVAFAAAQTGYSQFTDIVDDFSTSGNLGGMEPDAGAGPWTLVSGTDGPVVTNGALTIPAASGDVAQLNFSSSNITSGTVYLGFHFTVSSSGSLTSNDTISSFTGFRTGTAASGDPVLGFGTFRPSGNAQTASSLAATSTSQFYAGIFDGVTHNAVSSPLSAWATPLNRGTTYRAVIGFDVSNDFARLWIDPSSSDASSITLAALTGSPRGIFVREGASSHGAITFDNLNVSMDFNSAAGLSAIPEPSTYAAFVGAIALLGAILYRRNRKPV